MSIFDKDFPTMDIDNNFIIRQPSMSEADVKSIYKIYNDPKILRFVPDGCIPQGLDGAIDETRMYMDYFLNFNSVYWFIAEKQINKAIGTIGFCTWDKYNSRLEISYNLMSEYWGKGIMTNALKKTIKFGFDKMNGIRIQAQLDPSNEISIHLLQKLGFKKDGLLRKYRFYKDNKHIDVLMMSLLEEDFIV